MTISAKIIADSISPQGIRLTTFELDYPRFIHAEVKTHRMLRFESGSIQLMQNNDLMHDPMLSRNAQSSRAVPVSKSLNLEYVEPIIWGRNKSGMSSTDTLNEEEIKEARYYWHALVKFSRDFAERLSNVGLHKQWANRPLEWHSNIKVVITATEWENFFWLRIDPDAAQPEVVELATLMKGVMDASTPQLLQPGQWHLPYVGSQVLETSPGCFEQIFTSPDSSEFLSLETAKKISASCCAQVSYRKLDTSIEKALEIYEKLFSGPKPHLSPVEHQATPMKDYTEALNTTDPFTWEQGVTHLSRDLSLWSGNLRGWIQQRQVM